MAARYPSRVFVAGEAIKAALDAVSFAAHPTTGDTPAVEFSDEFPDDGNECIVVGLNADPTRAEWQRMSPAGKDETLFFDVTFRTVVPGVETTAAVWDRLEAIAGQIEGIAYEHDASPRVLTLGFDGEHWTSVVAVTPHVWPTNQGWQGAVVTTFEIQASI
jgi:hypothetical protein